MSKIPDPPRPPEPDTSESIFVNYDKRPEPVGGYEAIQKKIVYPEIAREIGLKGKVKVQLLISSTGVVMEAKTMKSSGYQPLDEAALKAIRSVKWYPAMQRDKPVKVWIEMTFAFNLQ